MVQAICPNGTLRIIQVGGWVNHNIPAHKVLVRNRFGEYIPGLTASKPPHFMTEQERKAPLEMKDITVDVGAVSVSYTHLDVYKRQVQFNAICDNGTFRSSLI